MKYLVLLLLATPLFGQEAIKVQSSQNFDNAVKSITDFIKSKKITIFATIDHKKNAKSVKLDMPNSKVIIFGNPMVGTALMNDNMDWSYELPLKIAVYEDPSGKVWIRSRTLSKDIPTPKEQAKITAVNQLLTSIVNEGK